MKYIRFKNGFIVFPDSILHNEVFNQEIISAGKLKFNHKIDVSVYGESISLGKCPLEDDGEYINRMFEVFN